MRISDWSSDVCSSDLKIEDLRQTHANVKFVDRTRFDDAGWTTGGEPSESTAVVITHDDGSVEIREGLIPPVIDESDDGEGGFFSDAGDLYRADYDTDALTATSGPATTPSSPHSDSAELSGADAASDEEVVKKKIGSASCRERVCQYV